MTLGQKIKKLRIKTNLTQKDLADKLHVTFQTVSKWEADTNEPDVSTLRELAKLFDCSMDFLLSEEEIELPKEDVKEDVIPVPTEPVTKTIIIHQREAHVCELCKKDIAEDDLDIDHVPTTHRHGRTSHTTYSDYYYHKECLAKVKDQRAKAAEAARKAKATKSKKITFGWGIAAGVVSLAISLGCLLAIPECQNALHPAAAVAISIFISYAMFATLYCILSTSYICEVFTTVASWSIRFPGLIFTWDIEGIAWLIGMKILFAILGFFISVFVFLFALSLSAALASVSFPFILISNIRNQYKYAF